jgi:hypothetical protein
MFGYQVMASALTVAGRAATDAADQADSVRPGQALAAVPIGLPGSSSARAALELSEAIQAMIADWSRAARAFGENLRQAAEQYESSERRAEPLFRQWTLQ